MEIPCPLTQVFPWKVIFVPLLMAKQSSYMSAHYSLDVHPISMTYLTWLWIKLGKESGNEL